MMSFLLVVACCLFRDKNESASAKKKKEKFRVTHTRPFSRSKCSRGKSGISGTSESQPPRLEYLSAKGKREREKIVGIILLARASVRLKLTCSNNKKRNLFSEREREKEIFVRSHT
jgi:hypothetical protein